MSSNAINLYIGNHNSGSITDFIEFLSKEASDAGLRPVITYQLFPAEHFDQPDFKEKAQQYVDFYKAFMDEDTDMINALQNGMKSRFYEPGVVSPFEAGLMGTIKHSVDDIGTG